MRPIAVKPDNFDRMTGLRLLRLLQPVCRKYKELLLYLIFGVLTFVVSVAAYAAGEYLLGLSPLWANVLSWVLAVSFAYVTNRTWVFEGRAETAGAVLRECLTFVCGRLFTLGLEEVLLAAGIYGLGWNSLAVKVIAQIVVVVSNYFISRSLVFRGRA